MKYLLEELNEMRIEGEGYYLVRSGSPGKTIVDGPFASNEDAQKARFTIPDNDSILIQYLSDQEAGMLVYETINENEWVERLKKIEPPVTVQAKDVHQGIPNLTITLSMVGPNQIGATVNHPSFKGYGKNYVIGYGLKDLVDKLEMAGLFITGISEGLKESEKFYKGNKVWFYHRFGPNSEPELFYGEITDIDMSTGEPLYALTVPGIRFEPGDALGRIYARAQDLRFDKP